MILADFGADVIRVDRIAESTTDVLGRGKRSVALDLKSPSGLAVLLALASKCDVLIDPFRPGVLEKMGLGPDVVLKANPRCIFARLTGFGQKGPYARMAGHDINYIAISGALAAIGRAGENPIFPANILGDFAGGGMLCVMGILLALFERNKSGLGQVIDSAMVDGASYLSTFIMKMRQRGVWNAPRGENMLDTGAHFYETYRTKDGKFMSVGSIEPQFYKLLINGLGLDPSTLPHQMDPNAWPEMKTKFRDVFLTKTRDEWVTIFDGTDACVAPVLEWDELMTIAHNRDRGLLVKDAESGDFEPRPAPRLSRTPGRYAGGAMDAGHPEVGEHTAEVLKEVGFSRGEIEGFVRDGAVMDRTKVRSKL
ncbi:hypothetical protein HK101_004688 [Irineochytrium annulatum]|nr:hypothetical protein HK101_004688 [Irineochytrium annulatum]